MRHKNPRMLAKLVTASRKRVAVKYVALLEEPAMITEALNHLAVALMEAIEEDKSWQESLTFILREQAGQEDPDGEFLEEEDLENVKTAIQIKTTLLRAAQKALSLQ